MAKLVSNVAETGLGSSPLLHSAETDKEGGYMEDKVTSFPIPADADIGASAIAIAFMCAAEEIGLTRDQISALREQAMINLRERISVTEADSPDL